MVALFQNCKTKNKNFISRYILLVVFYIGNFNMEKIIFFIIDNIIEYYRYIDYRLLYIFYQLRERLVIIKAYVIYIKYMLLTLNINIIFNIIETSL